MIVSARVLAERYGVHPNTVYRWVETPERQGGPPRLRLGSTLRFDTDQVDAWARQRDDQRGSVTPLDQRRTG